MVLQGEHRGEKGVSGEGLGGHLRRVQSLYASDYPGSPYAEWGNMLITTGFWDPGPALEGHPGIWAGGHRNVEM